LKTKLNSPMRTSFVMSQYQGFKQRRYPANGE
jgi:hypothetical protein